MSNGGIRTAAEIVIECQKYPPATANPHAVIVHVLREDGSVVRYGTPEPARMIGAKLDGSIPEWDFLQFNAVAARIGNTD